MTSLGHSRSTSLIDSRNTPMATNGVFNPPPPNGRHGGDNRPGRVPIPHIDDILMAPRDIDKNQSIRKLLESAEASLRQAELSRDFNRPSVALKEYIRASVIAVQVIRNHRDYVFLKDEHNDLSRAHNALLKKISQQDTSFARIKEEIIADNKRTGVKSTSPRPGSSQGNDPNSRSASPAKGSWEGRRLNNASQPHVNGSPAKTKPPIQPKPQSLHGKAISSDRSSLSLSTSAAQDLAARFANLRGPQASPGQDPRIKTHPLPKPAGPRAMPPPPSRPPKIDIRTNVPSLPKMPDAVYSPAARGSISGETPRPPSSTPRNTFTRTGSTASSVPGTPTSTSHTQSDYFAPAQSYSNTAIPPTAPANPIPIPQGETITPEELKYAMTCRGSILLIDVRSQEEFNEGHIMARSVICVEPSILTRENISADQIAESLVLSPNSEEMEFQDRATKDLVVFYDKESESFPRSARNSDDLVLISLKRALVDFNYGNELKNPPKLLKGGIDAWVDLMGQGSLQSVSQSLSRKKALSDGTRIGGIQRSKSKFTARSHKPAVAKAWEETIRNEEMETASSPTFVRTVSDFHRKFPPVPEKESMSSPSQPDSRPAYGSSHKVDLNTDLPSPPARPVPALPRTSFSRLSEGVDESATIPPARVPTKGPEQQPAGDNSRLPTGLNNPRNWCYANSLLQCLLASPEFGRELANSTWAEKYKAPKKKDEPIENPQLMTKIVSNLFHWMSTGKFQYMKAQTLMNYSLYVSKQDSIQRFGSADIQQDAQEFMSFLFVHLHDETNRRRDRPVPKSEGEPDVKTKSLLQLSLEFWSEYTRVNLSMIDQSWRYFNVESMRCLSCNKPQCRFEPSDVLYSHPLDRDGTLDQSMAKYVRSSDVEDYKCETPNCKGRTIKNTFLGHAPSLLCVAFKRFMYVRTNGGHFDSIKSTTRLTWDLDDMDFTSYFIQPSSGDHPTDPAFIGPFHYETYAVIVHEGATIKAGHYYAYVRDMASRDPHAWFRFNDTQVSRVRIGGGGPRDLKNKLFGDGSAVPYIAFFRRKPNP